ncbi:NAD(P)/FAD-dependent oxidoreductase [Pseudonocardia acaciae]|uniref:NAD(P)/FAD-dependent oxidoreductase n=1 Tax=Pseudonocardia acaciae TaxID=551276 RepID=UPI00055B7281|nr:FAD-dependent oxidoreductase [Pseudonocardia acaciae]
MPRPVLLTVGAGQAAVAAVRTLRRRGYDGRVVMLADEPHPPYQRPPLSKEYLRGDADLDDLSILDPGWCAENDVELRLGDRVTSIDTLGRRVELAGGGWYGADLMLLATGARARRLAGVGGGGGRVVHLRSLDDADRLRALLPGAGRLAVIGAGLIGSEVAASARELGVEVTCLEVAELPMLGQLGARMAEAYAGLHRENGVDLRCGRRVGAVTEHPGGVTVSTDAGEVEADLLVVAVGAEPRDELARAAGLALDPVHGGVAVDAECRTSVEGIFAAGDIASRLDPRTGRRHRGEHVDNANRQGAAVARAVLGQPAADQDPPWFWSDQYELALQFVGKPRPDAEVVVRGSVAERDFTAFYLADGRVHAAFAVDRGGDVPAARELITRAVPVSEAALADEDTDLFDLLETVDA